MERMTTSMHQRAYLSISEVAAELGVSRLTVRRKIETGELPATQLGGPGSSIRIPAEALRAWLWGDYGE
jgi:excisionase family DNA binding protein